MNHFPIIGSFTQEESMSLLMEDLEKYPVGEGFKFLNRVSDLLSHDHDFVDFPRLRDDDKTIVVVDF